MRRRLVRSLLSGLVLLTPAFVLAATVAFNPGKLDAPDGAVRKDDLLMATYADAVYPDPLDPLKAAPVRTVGGCLSVARFQLESLRPTLDRSASLVFACDEVPQTARVLGWIDGAWQPVPFDRDPNNRVRIQFQRLTTYAIVDNHSGPSIM